MKKPYLIVIVLFSFFVLNSAAAVLVNHDDIPFIYEYIIPISHEHLELSESTLYFQVSPYTFKLPMHDDEFRVLDKSAKECYLSLWSSYVPNIPLPNDYRVDGPYQ